MPLRKINNKLKKPKTHSTKTSEGKRVRDVPKHRSFRLTKGKIRQPKPLPGIKELVRDPVSLVLANKKLFLILTLVYAVLIFVLAKGLGSTFDIVQTKQELQDYAGSDKTDLGTSYTLFSYLIGTFNSQASEAAGAYQLFIAIFVILATVWISRQLFNGEKVRVRDGFYKGMYPLIPFLLVLGVLSLQMLPAVFGNFLFSTIISQGLAVTFLEKAVWFMLFLALLTLSLYMVLSSIFALAIVTLPDVRPMQALRSARELVLHRRFGIFARLIVLPLMGLIIAAALFIPLLMYVPVVVEPLFLLASSFGMIFMIVYIYNFYRKLL